MTFWDVLLLWLLTRLAGKTGPKWPGPGTTGPSGPTGPTGPTGPSPTGPTGPTGPTAKQTDWKPYFYIQPDAGAPYGTPYNLAGAWHGKGTAWVDIYNWTQQRPLGGKIESGSPSYAPSFDGGEGGGGGGGGSGGGGGTAKTFAANVGDKLLIPYTWPEPPNDTIKARCEPIPADVTVPKGKQLSVSGDESAETI